MIPVQRQTRPGSAFHLGTFPAQLLCGGQHPHPAVGAGCRSVNGLTIKHRRVARVFTFVREQLSVAHERVLLSPSQHRLSRLP
jgi:hypothetical protein